MRTYESGHHHKQHKSNSQERPHKEITKICTEYPDVFNKQLISYISQQLYPLTIVDEGIKKKHINDIKDRCPVCGRTLVERTAKTGPNAGGKFLGCSGFPNCRYTRKI